MTAHQKWVVDYEKDVANQLRAAFKDGKITAEDMRVIKRWVREVEEMGLEFATNSQEANGSGTGRFHFLTQAG